MHQANDAPLTAEKIKAAFFEAIFHAIHSSEQAEIARHIKTVERQLKDGVIDVNTKSVRGESALHIIVRYDYYETATSAELAYLLLQNGADVNIKDNTGSTPFHYAVSSSRIPMVELLLAAHADIEVPNSLGKIPESIAEANLNFRPQRALYLCELFRAYKTCLAEGTSCLAKTNFKASDGLDESDALALHTSINRVFTSIHDETPNDRLKELVEKVENLMDAIKKEEPTTSRETTPDYSLKFFGVVKKKKETMTSTATPSFPAGK